MEKIRKNPRRSCRNRKRQQFNPDNWKDGLEFQRKFFVFLIFLDCLKTPEPESSEYENQSWVPGDDGRKRTRKKRTKTTKNEGTKNQKIKKKKNLRKEGKVESRSEALKRMPYGGKSPRFLVKRNPKKSSTRNVKNSGIVKNVFYFGLNNF